MYYGTRKILLIFLYLLFFYNTVVLAEEKKVAVIKEFKDSLQTNIIGTSENSPPYVKIIRSKAGVEHMMNDFKRIRNYAVHDKITLLEKELTKTNFNNHMLIAILTQPIDNFIIDFKGVFINKIEKKLEVMVDYRHIERSYDIPPKKSIYYHMIVIKKNDLPVFLRVRNLQHKKILESSPSIIVSGRLLYWKYQDLQLVPLKIKRKKSTIYYIKGRQAIKLEKYVGKVVTLKGKISRENDSPYEADLEVEKLVEVKGQ
ncbi:MAG: hypothetical protein AABZ11_10280 [Nitrospinota bacterium]|jgi:hypothetical protein